MKLRIRLLLDYYVGGLLHASLKIPTIILGRLLHRDHDLSRCHDLAVMKLLGGGSLVIAYPALLALRRLPHIRKMILVTTPSIRPFGETLGIFDEIVVLREDSFLHLALDSFTALWRLFRLDAIIDLEVHSRLTTVFSLLTLARNRVGFFTNISFWRRDLSTHLLFCNTSNGIYQFYDQIALIFGATPISNEESTAAFRRQIDAREALPSGLHLAIAPTCSDLSRERMLNELEWLEIVERRLEHAPPKAYLYLFGGPSDREYLEKLKGQFLERFGERVEITNYAGRTKLQESVHLMSGMTEVLCVDSALLHFSRLLGLRTISYWGPTDPRVLARPRAAELDEFHYVKLPCSPCIHVSNQPPCKGNNICMRLAADPKAHVPSNPPWVLK